MESVNVAAEDADSMASNRSQVQVDYFIIPYISIFIRFSDLYEQLYVHFIVIINDGGDGIGRSWLIYNVVWVGEQGLGITL